MTISLERPAMRVHRIVRIDWLVRVSTYPMYLLLYGLFIWPRHASWAVWLLFVWHLLIWPHVAFYVASRAVDTKRAELRNLLLDSFFIGMAVPLTSFSLWPNTAGFIGINTGNVLNGGARFALRGMFAFIAGVIVMGAITGFAMDPLGSSLLIQLLSIAVMVAFSTVFSHQMFAQSKNVIQYSRQIRTQNTQIEEKSRELEVALVASESANAAKGNFLANMSHELRTPLNSIIGFANILQRKGRSELKPKDATYLSRISANGSHLLTLINGVLDLSKIEAHQMHLELSDVDVSALLTECLDQMEPQAEAREVELLAELPTSAVLRTDRARLKQIILNLVGNAIKFTHRGRVTVRLHVDEQTGQPSRIDIVDSGIGIAPDRLGKIFDAFQQEDETTSRRYGGTGLGLTITRSLAHLMGWEIEVSSAVGIGSTFSVRIARAAPITPARPTYELRAYVGDGRQGTEGRSLRPFRVLVIEVDFDARALLQHQLEDFGCKVISAATAEEGLSLTLRVRPDLITVDLTSPRSREVLRVLRESAELSEVPIVAMSVAPHEKRRRILGAVMTESYAPGSD
ncbi:MAG: ATP-binding protein [Gemmatimonadaceae bacterium]